METENTKSEQSNLNYLQRACLITAICHTLAIFTSIYSFRAGDLSQFSVIRLASFAASQPNLWQLNCLTFSLACLSVLFLMTCIFQFLPRKASPVNLFYLCLVVMAVGIDLSAFSDLMVNFLDISARVVGEEAGGRVLFSAEAWLVLNRSIAHILLIANTLYALAGIGSITTLLNEPKLPGWIGWSALAVWSLFLLISFFTLFSLIPAAILLLLITLIAYISWSVAIFVYLELHKENQTTKHI